MLHTSDFSYSLPADLIAHTPLAQRDASRLLVLRKNTGEVIHSNFRVLPSFLQKGDVLVRNNSKVFKARLFGYKQPTGGKVEILLNKVIKSSTDTCIWECIVKPGVSAGQKLRFGTVKLIGECTVAAPGSYTRQIEFRASLSDFYGIVDEIGEVPLPPYIDPKRAEAVASTVPNMSTDATQSKPTESLAERYQTTYAAPIGSAAAPTAGLHFTKEIDAELKAMGVEIHEVTLHVGLGTFLPVKSDDITKHTMHSEQYVLSEATAAALNAAKREGRRIIAVGTTTCRVLESCAVAATEVSASTKQAIALSASSGTPKYLLKAQATETDIFIYPPYEFKFLDGLITNFHLPESTLLMLISALVSAPNTSHSFTSFAESSVGKAYHAAIENNYRFFSFGDSMLII